MARPRTTNSTKIPPRAFDTVFCARKPLTPEAKIHLSVRRKDMFGCYYFTRVYSSLSTDYQGGRAAPIVSLVYMCLSKFSVRTKNQDIILKSVPINRAKPFTSIVKDFTCYHLWSLIPFRKVIVITFKNSCNLPTTAHLRKADL